MSDLRHFFAEAGKVVFNYADSATKQPFSAEITCALPGRCHVDAPAIMAEHRAWANRFGLLPEEGAFARYCASRFDLLAAYQCHDSTRSAAALHAHLMTWFFVFDDAMDIDHGLADDERHYLAELCRRHLAMLDGAPPTAGDVACTRAFHDFLQQAQAGAGVSFVGTYTRLVHHLREYIAGARWESLIGPTTDKNSNTALYLQVRHMAVGVAPCLDLMAIAAGLPGQTLGQNFFIQRLERLAINFSIWVNDLAGLNRDIKRGLGNVAFTLQHDHQLSLPAATQMLARLCDAELTAFLRVEAQLPMLLGPEYAQNKDSYDIYLTIMKRWMRGLLDWSVCTERYQRLDVDMALQNELSIRARAQTGWPASD